MPRYLYLIIVVLNTNLSPNTIPSKRHPTSYLNVQMWTMVNSQMTPTFLPAGVHALYKHASFEYG